MFGIVEWCSQNENVCPYCECDFRTLAPEQNIYPHYTSACMESESEAASVKLIAQRNKFFQFIEWALCRMGI